jgi:hypothetical protein
VGSREQQQQLSTMMTTMGNNNCKGGATAGLRVTMPTEMSVTTKLTKTTTMVMGCSVRVIQGRGGKGPTHHCPQGS